MYDPAALAIPLRLSPSGPPVSAATLVQIILGGGLLGVTRVWNTGNCPGSNIDLDPGTEEVIQRFAIPCTAAQLGRNYLCFGQVVIVGSGEDLETQPGAVLAIWGNGTPTYPGPITAIQHRLPVVLGNVTHGESDIFPWLCHGSSYFLLKPGTMCPAFEVGTNWIFFEALIGDQSVEGEIVANMASVTIIEIDGDLANLALQVPYSEGGGPPA